MGPELAADLHIEHSPLHNFEVQHKLFVDFGLFFFAFTNAGVSAGRHRPDDLADSRLAGDREGRGDQRPGPASPSGWASRCPTEMGVRELVMAALVAALGLTVALFVAGAAFVDPDAPGAGEDGGAVLRLRRHVRDRPGPRARHGERRTTAASGADAAPGALGRPTRHRCGPRAGSDCQVNVPINSVRNDPILSSYLPLTGL